MLSNLNKKPNKSFIVQGPSELQKITGLPGKGVGNASVHLRTPRDFAFRIGAGARNDGYCTTLAQESRQYSFLYASWKEHGRHRRTFRAADAALREAGIRAFKHAYRRQTRAGGREGGLGASFL